MKVLEIKGLRSLRALNARNVLMLGLKMLPAHAHEKYEDFFAMLDSMTEADQEKMVREAVNFVDLNKDDVEALLSFCADKNGIPFGPENINNLNPIDIRECLVAVCMKITKIKTDFITQDEKKNSEISL